MNIFLTLFIGFIVIVACIAAGIFVIMAIANSIGGIANFFHRRKLEKENGNV